MGLSEFIAKNNEHPDLEREFQTSRQLVKTIIDSGAIPLLEKLEDSIRSNPTLSSGSDVILSKRIFVCNRDHISRRIKDDPLFKGFFADLLKHQRLPIARVSVGNWRLRTSTRYNGPFSPPTDNGFVMIENELRVECEETGRLKLYGIRENRPIEINNLEENQWKQQRVIDDILGKIYAEVPVGRI